MAIECNNIIAEAQALQLKFQKCKTLSAADMRRVMELVISLKNCMVPGSGILVDIIEGDNISIDKSDITKPVISAILTGNKTVSLSVPIGIPANGDEWITYTNPE